MEWTSDELKRYYNILNKVYSTTLKSKFPHLVFVLIDPEDFLKKIQSKSWSIDVDVYACVDWSLKKEEGSGNLGESTVTIMMRLQDMLEKPSEIGSRKIYPSLKLNTTKYCKGLIPHTNDYF